MKKERDKEKNLEIIEFSYKGYRVKTERKLGKIKKKVTIFKEDKLINEYETSQGYFILEQSLMKDIDVVEQTGGQI